MNKIVFYALGSIGVALTIISAIVLGQWSNIIQSQVNKKLIIAEESDNYDKFVAPNVPIYLKFYLFDVKNPDEIMNGSKPIVEQKGPYSFLEKRVKKVEGFLGDKVTYKEVKTFHFDAATTGEGLSLDDAFTHLNIPWMTVMRKTYSLALEGQGSMTRELLPKLIVAGKSFKEPVKMFLTHTAGELLFDTYPIEFIDDLNKIVTGIFRQPKVDLKDFAYFMEKNGTDEGTFVVNTGKNNIKDLLLIDSWEGSGEVNFWVNGSKCNSIEGTDATGFAPNVKKDSKLEIFTTDLCRSFPLEFQSKTKVKGISTNRYVIPAKAFYGHERNPENKCYCVAPFETDCKHNGLLDVSTCKKYAPLVASSPMFFNADDDLYDAIEGLPERNPELHRTYLDIEPISGKVFSAAKRLQISANLKQEYCPVKTKANVYLPLVWIEESFTIDDAIAKEFKSKIHTPRKFVVVGLVLGLLLIVAAIGLFFYNKTQAGR